MEEIAPKSSQRASTGPLESVRLPLSVDNVIDQNSPTTASIGEEVKIAVVGGSGLIGRHLTVLLSGRGDEVVVVSRRATPVPGAHTVLRWDPVADAVPVALGDVDAVVNLAGESIVGRWSDSKKRAIRESRVVTTTKLAEVVGSGGPSVLVNASAVGFYGDRGDAELTEQSAPGTGFLADVCKEWEAAALTARPRGARVVVARTGLVLAREGGALPPMARATRFGMGGPLGGGRQFYPWVHISDVVGAIAWALDNDSITGPMNVTAPIPVPQREIATALGQELHRPAIIPALRPAIRLLLGEAADLVLMSQRVVPRALTQSHYRFNAPNLADALHRELGPRP